MLLCKYCTKECKNNNSLRNHERLCKYNPNRQLTTYEKYGPTKGFNNVGRVAWNEGLNKNSDTRVANISKTLSKKMREGTIVNHQKGKLRTQEEKNKISKSMLVICKERNSSLCGKGKRGYYKGYYCQSSWELAYVIYCLEHGIKLIRNKKRFSYVIDNIERSYFPDFYLIDTDTYVEIKGYYDRKTKFKVEQFKNNLLVLEKSGMKNILKYCIDKYGKDFTYLYSNN